MTKNFKQKNRAFTLVETLIAISIFSFSILGLLLVLGQGISDTGYAKQKIIAGYLAQEGIEYIRNMRDSYVLYTNTDSSLSWTNFYNKITSCPNNAPCQFIDDNNSNFEDSINSCTNGCKLYVDNGDYNYDSIGVDSGFTRNIKANIINSNEIKIISTVSWVQGSTTHDIILTENLFNWVE